jgi:DNA-binding transcriptional ArsR family regulator
MPVIPRIEEKRRSVVLEDRLSESRLIRRLGLRPDTAEVSMAIAQGYYDREAINVTEICRRTLQNKETVRRHAKILMQERGITITRRGQDTIFGLSEEALVHERTLAYFEERYAALLRAARRLEELGVTV